MKRKKMAEHFQPKLFEWKKLFAVWQNDLKNEKVLKDIEEEHAKAENEYKEQQKEKKEEGQTILPCKEGEKEAFLR